MKRKRTLWSIERAKSLLCGKDNMVYGVCWPTRKLAEEANLWAKGKIVKFVEAVS
jgi:hypothetical protein